MTTEIAGVDFSDAKPDPAALLRDGFQFVVGYLKPLQAGGVPNPKELTADYITRARAAGLAIAVVFETTTGRALSGAAGGAADAVTARARATVLGYPTSAVCFAAVDQDVAADQFPTITAYLTAFAAEWGGPAGGYGEFDLIEHLAAAAPPLYRWQAGAWSGGRLSTHAHLYQRTQPSGHWPVIAGTDEDVLCAPIPWYGPGPVQAPTPPPHTPSTAPVFDVAAWRASAGQSSPHIQALQQWGSRCYPAYCRISPTDPHYGPQTVAFVREFAHRSGITSADGENIGPQIAAALAKAGFPG